MNEERTGKCLPQVEHIRGQHVTFYEIMIRFVTVDKVRHTSGYFFMLDPASKVNVGMIRQMTTAF